MPVITDNKFIRQTLGNQDAGNVFNQKKFNPADLTGIVNKDVWNIKKTLGNIISSPSIDDDKYPIGTLVEFHAPDGTEYKGRVASKSGRDYIIEISAGESYLVPSNKLAKVTPESDKIKEAMRRHTMPTIRLVSKPAIEMANRCCARIAYKERRPTDDDLIKWAEEHYPDWRLVDAVNGDNREIGLIFEIIAMEDDKPQGGDQVNRGRALSSESIEGTGVIAEEEYQDQFPGGLADDKTPEDFCPHALEDGINVEMEHTDDPDLAREIAMDHLTEDPQYYIKLRKIESNIITFNDIESTVFDMPHKAQIGDPGSGDEYKDLVRAARWVLARFNDSNPDFYAVPQKSVEMAGDPENRVVRVPFILQAKDENDDLSHMYISRSGQLFHESDKGPDMQSVHGFVQVDDQGNLPMVMLDTPIGPESVQEYGFNFSADREIIKLADYDACLMAANDVLNEFGGYSAEAQAAYDARLIKLAVDPKAKEYWSGYFKDYGKMFTRDIPRKKHNRKKTAQVDQTAKDYWTNYFGSGVYDDRWYGEALVRDIPRRIIDDNNSSSQELSSEENIESEEIQKKEAFNHELERYKKIASDYTGYIKEEKGKYCVKSKSNPDWSGGCYDTKEEAESRLKQVEMFKHMSIKACITDSIPADIDFIDRMTIVGIMLDDIINKKANHTGILADNDIEALFGFSKRKVTAPRGSSPELKTIVDTAQWALEIAQDDQQMYSAVYSLVYNFLQKHPNFLIDQIGETSLTPRAIGYTLVYALRNSPKALRQLKKNINKYQKRWQKDKWRGLSEEAKQWRQEQKQLKKKEKDKEPERGEGPSEWDEEEQLQVEVPSEKPVIKQPPPPATAKPKKPLDIRHLQQKRPEESVGTSTLPQGYQMEYVSMRKKRADPALGPITHNAPGKDDKEDYDHKDNHIQPSRLRTRFKITRMYSTTSSSDNGYIYMDISWDPETMVNMSDQNIQQAVISYVKGLESNKEFHDFGVMGRVRIIDFDKDAGVTRIKVRCSETRGVPTLGYNGDVDEPIPLSGIR